MLGRGWGWGRMSAWQGDKGMASRLEGCGKEQGNSNLGKWANTERKKLEVAELQDHLSRVRGTALEGCYFSLYSVEDTVKGLSTISGSCSESWVVWCVSRSRSMVSESRADVVACYITVVASLANVGDFYFRKLLSASGEDRKTRS